MNVVGMLTSAVRIWYYTVLVILHGSLHTILLDVLVRNAGSILLYQQ